MQHHIIILNKGVGDQAAMGAVDGNKLEAHQDS